MVASSSGHQRTIELPTTKLAKTGQDIWATELRVVFQREHVVMIDAGLNHHKIREFRWRQKQLCTPGGASYKKQAS
jgi:hypothetical protein